MFKKRQNKGFTIVELVIVIAVIAILSAVLIPTFSGLIKKANVTADQTLVRNLNTSLAISQGGGTSTNKTMYQTLEDMKGQGYSVEKLTPTSTGSEIVWDSEKNQFVLIMKDKNGNAEYYTGTAYTEYNEEDYYKLWKIYTNVADTTNSIYSIYLADNSNIETINVNGVGFDVGRNTSIKFVNYTNSSSTAKNVIVRTSDYSTKLSVDAENDTVSHYGKCGELVVTNVASNSYHEFGTVIYAELNKGRVVVEQTGKIEVALVKTTDAKLEKNNGTLENAYALSEAVKNANTGLELTFETGKTEEEMTQIATDKKSEVMNKYTETIPENIDYIVSNSAELLALDVSKFDSSKTTVIGLKAGTYSTYNTTTYQGKNVEFVGLEGSNLTRWTYGKSASSDNEYCADYSLENSNVTFTNITLKDNFGDNLNYRGFVRPSSMKFNNCVFESRNSYWGSGSVEFTNCTFESTGDYNLWAYSGTSFVFDNCTFKSEAGKFINAYQQQSSGVVSIEIKDCKFEGGSKYPAVKIKKENVWQVTFIGENDVSSLANGTATNSPYYEIESGIKEETKVIINGVTVWENGAKVSN